MTKQDVLDQVGREVQDTSPGFLAILASGFDWVVLELAQRGAIEQLIRTATFQFAPTVASYSTRTCTGLAAPYYPSEIRRLTVAGWGAEGRLRKLTEDQFDRYVLGWGSQTGRPFAWRLYPNSSTIEVYPIPDADNSGANGLVTVEFRSPPVMLTPTENISEILVEDVPTLKAGLYMQGVKFRDETYQDRQEALARFEQGIAAMKLRQWNMRYRGRDLRGNPVTPSL
jgi:hypothetical protein